MSNLNKNHNKKLGSIQIDIDSKNGKIVLNTKCHLSNLDIELCNSYNFTDLICYLMDNQLFFKIFQLSSFKKNVSLDITNEF